MLATDEHAENLFARLFSYAPRAERNPLEDYCTEGLAWLLVKSPEFAALFLTTIRERLGVAANTQLTSYRGALHVSTQMSYTGEDNDSGDGNDSRGGRFDLVIKPEGGENFIVVLESKVGLDPNVGTQAAEYKEKLKRHPQFSQVSKGEQYVLTLTPASGTPDGADAHLIWHDVYELLDCCSKSRPSTNPLKPWFNHFADFHFAHLALHVAQTILDSATIQNFQEIGPFLAVAKEHFGAFANDEVLKKFFRKRDAEHPIVAFDEGDQDVWYGIDCTKEQRYAYAGLIFRGKEIALYAQVNYTTDLTDRHRTMKDELLKAATAATDFFGSNSEREGKGLSIYFVRRHIEGDTSDVTTWFRGIFDEISNHFEGPPRRR